MKLVYILIFILVVFLAYNAFSFLPHNRPHVNSIWVINLDKENERWKHIQESTAHIDSIVHRWSATDGSTLTRNSAFADGVGYTMTQTGNRESDYKTGAMRNRGVVGCWISHKRLMTHIAAQDYPDYSGHLILEDDVDIPRDFLKSGDRWHSLYKKIPRDWDIVYLGMTKPVGTYIADGVLKNRSASPGDAGNWGSYAYLVRHGSLKTKILPQLEFMTDAIDEQCNVMFKHLNVYTITPSIIQPNKELNDKSTINKINANQ